MTAAAIADLLHAHRTGPGRWQARCPAHRPDKHPSLSIKQGTKGVLLRCWSNGCTVASICAALGLKLSDLFDGPPPTPEQTAQARLQALREEEQARERRARHGAICDKLLKLEAIAGQLGARLMRLPDSSPDADGFARLFHSVQDSIHRAETEEMEARP